MNIFFLDYSPETSAKAMTDKHIVKMILESAQMLCTAHRVLDGYPTIFTNDKGRKITRYSHPSKEEELYKSAYVNHQTNVWVRQTSSNYNWLYRHFLALNIEYRLRYKRTHSSWDRLAYLLSQFPKNITHQEMTPIYRAMPNVYKTECPIESYRNYYISEKLKNKKDTDRYQLIIY